MTPSASLALDPRGLEKLRSQAGSSPEKATREASKQFEVMFVNMLLKSMRDAAPEGGPMANEQTKMYTSMLDQQLSQSIANRGIGLADVDGHEVLRPYGSEIGGDDVPGRRDPVQRRAVGRNAPKIGEFTPVTHRTVADEE